MIAVVGVLMGVVWRSPQRTDLATFWSLTVALVAAVTPLVVYLAKRSRLSGAGQGERIDLLTEALAGAVKEQWARAAAERQLLYPEPIPVRWARSCKPIAGPASVAADSVQFSPLPGLAPCRIEQLMEGDIQDLHAVYGGLGSGRLVIVGPPGSGKSGAAVLLILAALRYREQLSREAQPMVPIPVMCTFAGWDPATRPVGDWLAGQLREVCPFLAPKGGLDDAGALVAAGRVAVILDGLDEMPAALRPVALQALSRQTNVRVVILSRDAEMVDAAAQHFLEGAVALELQDIRSEVAADYLTRVQRHPPLAAWNELTDFVRRHPASPIAAALSTPLTLTLVRDTYREADDVGDLLAFCDAIGSNVSRELIEDHLLDRVLPTAYALQPGEPPPRYRIHDVERWMGYIATRMNQENARDLVWWHIRMWASSQLYVVATCLICIFMGVIVGGLGFGAKGAVIGGFAYGLYSLLGAGLLLKMRDEFPTPPSLSGPLRLRQLFSTPAVAVGMISGLVVGLIFWLVASLAFGAVKGIAAGFAFGVSSGLLGWVGGWLACATKSLPEKNYTSPLTPRTSWRHVQGLALVTGLRIALVAGLVIWLGAGLTRGLVVELGGALVVGLMGVIITPQTWPASLAFAQLALRGETPARFAFFLEDARKRGVLRTVGPTYQFRHARLQDRLAQRAASARPVPGVAMQPSATASHATIIDDLLE